jgi:hypothetical protein
MDNPDIQFYGIIITGILTSIGLIFVGYQTMMLRKEKNQTLRAWIDQADSQFQVLRYFNQKNEIKTRQEWENMSVKEHSEFQVSKLELAIKLKNFGQLPAMIRGRYFYSIEEKPPSRKDISNIEFGDPFVIMPQGEQFLIIEDTMATFHTSKGGIAYMIIDLKYTSGDSDEEKKYGMLAELTRGGYKIKEIWNEKTF